MKVDESADESTEEHEEEFEWDSKSKFNCANASNKDWKM